MGRHVKMVFVYLVPLVIVVKGNHLVNVTDHYSSGVPSETKELKPVSARAKLSKEFVRNVVNASQMMIVMNQNHVTMDFVNLVLQENVVKEKFQNSVTNPNFIFAHWGIH